MVFVLLNDLVTTSKGVAEVSGRLEKIERLAGLLRRFAQDVKVFSRHLREVTPAVPERHLRLQLL
jgi:hypothetical protein